jgi:hypothetical protein
MTSTVNRAIAVFRALLADGRTLDEALDALRRAGLSKVESMAVLARSGHCDLIAAKQLVHFSPVWDDRRERDEQFHDLLESALDGVVEGEDAEG